MKLFAQKDAEEFLKSGATEFRYNRDTRLTPGAKDVFSEAGVKVVFDAEAAVSAPAAPAASAGKTDDQKLFHSPEAERIKEEICDIGRRIWAREYCDGNGGNISARIGPDRFIVHPDRRQQGLYEPRK